MTRERRIFRGEFRDVPGSDGRQKWATAVTYNTVDTYGTLWRPGVFDEALGERMPVILYGHDWSSLNHVLGAGIDWRQTPADVGPPGVDVLIEFLADDEHAARAMKLLAKDATSAGPVLRDVSVGFERREWARRSDLTAEELKIGAEEAMIRAGMDELSLVVAGAVPGAQVRSASGALSNAPSLTAEKCSFSTMASGRNLSRSRASVTPMRCGQCSVASTGMPMVWATSISQPVWPSKASPPSMAGSRAL